MKKLLVILGIIVAVLIVIAIALPFVIDVNRFKPTLETDLSSALGRKVEIGNIELSILSGGVKVDDVSIADDPAFSRSPFLQARQLTAGVALIPLIFSKKLAVSSFTVTEPKVSLLRSTSGVWNFSSLGAGSSKAPSKKSDPPGGSASSSTANISVDTLKISDGTIVVGTAGARGKTQTYQAVDLEASNLSYTSQFPFTFTAKTPGGGSVKVEGKAGPIDSSDASLTPLDAKIDVGHLDLASTGFVDASSGLAGVLDFTGDLASDGHEMKSKGTVKAEKIKVVAGGSPSTVPVNVDYSTAYDLKRETGSLQRGDVHIGKALARLTGSYDTAGATTSVNMKLNGQAMPVADLEGILPAAGITLPSGASLESGGLDLNLSLSGPVDKLVIAGPVNLSNGKLKNFSLKSKLGALSSFAGLGGGGGGSDTDLQTLSADLHVDPSGTQASNLNIVAPAIGTITGNGNVSATGQLNCKMVAKLAAGSAVGSMTSALSSFTGGGNSSSGGGIPFTITGTTSSPVFLPDLKGMAGSMVKGMGTNSGSAASAAQGILGGLFGKKKTN
ncbi:MAG TPA: AsmA family protein [Candidatus Acidoferrales bacterium]|nr:AsmA family protein [Candidatus Acidoferrales bacterium]